MSDQLGHGEHRPDHRHDVYDQCTQDQTEDPVEDVGLELGAKGGDIRLELGVKLGDVDLGGEFGILNRGDHGLGLRLGEAGLAQSFATFRYLSPSPAAAGPHRRESG